MHLHLGVWVCALAACSAPGPNPGPLPQLDGGSLGPALQEQLAPVLATLRSSPSDPTLSGKAGMLLQAYGQHGLAVEFFERATLLDAGEFRWEYYLGISLAALGQHAEAERSFRRCLEMDPGSVSARRRLGNLLFETGRVQESLAAFREAMPAGADDPRIDYGLGRAAAAMDQPDMAFEHLLRAVEIAPTFGAAHYALSLLYRDEGSEADSRAHLELFERYRGQEPPGSDPLTAAVRSLRTSATVYLQQGVEAMEAGRYDEAIRLHLKATDEDPSLLQARINLVILYGSRAQANEAEEQYRLGLKAGADSAELHYNYGVIAYSTGKTAEAKQAFRMALDLNPGHASANHNMGQMLEEEGRFDEAALLYEKALENRPDHGLSHYKLGMLRMRQRNLPAALRSFREAIKEESDLRPEFLFRLAGAELVAGDRDAAIGHLRLARQEASRYTHLELVSRIDQTLKSLEALGANP